LVSGRFMPTVFGHRKKQDEDVFLSFTLLHVVDDDVTWVLLRRYVVTKVTRQRVTRHPDLPHPAVVPFAQFRLESEKE
jgi:hypothetical protein